MVSSVFLAKVLGLYLLVLTLGLIFNKKYYQGTLKELLEDRPSYLIAGIVPVIIGILLVLSHNVWILHWPVIITIIAWLALMVGAWRIIFPRTLIKWKQRYIQNDWAYYITVLLVFILGCFLIYKGFF